MDLVFVETLENINILKASAASIISSYDRACREYAQCYVCKTNSLCTTHRLGPGFALCNKCSYLVNLDSKYTCDDDQYQTIMSYPGKMEQHHNMILLYAIFLKRERVSHITATCNTCGRSTMGILEVCNHNMHHMCFSCIYDINQINIQVVLINEYLMQSGLPRDVRNIVWNYIHELQKKSKVK